LNPKIIIGAVAAVLQFFAPLSTSIAGGNLVKIEFCNNFPQMVNFAIAYQQTTGDWMSRGWLNMETASCYYFDTALRLPVFYFRAQTDAYRDKGHRVIESWGDKGAGVKSFCVAKSLHVSFKYWGSDTKSNCHESYVSFEADGGDNIFETEVDGSLQVTFNADGTTDTLFVPLKPSAPPAK
jgi:uncharacterized membrane protein